MVRFQCDTCGRLRGANEQWILGLAAQTIGVTSARREIAIQSTWDRARAVNSFAVHFCSDECRSRYMEALFGPEPTTLTGDVTTTKRRVQRVFPGAIVDTVVSEKAGPTVSGKSAGRKKQA
jgi:hypothetical protein